MEKRRNCSSGAISPLFHNILLHVVRFSYLGRDQIFTSREAVIRDKRVRDNESRLYMIFLVTASDAISRSYRNGQAGRSFTLISHDCSQWVLNVDTASHERYIDVHVTLYKLNGLHIRSFGFASS